MSATDLSTPTAVQSYLGTEGADTDIIGTLIASVSRNILSYCGRDSFLSKQYDEVRDGRGTPSIVLRRWPVTSIAHVFIYGQEIPQGTNTAASTAAAFNPFASSYMFEAWDGDPPGRVCRLDLRSGIFARDNKNVEIVYQAGYAIEGEVQTINVTNFQMVPLAPNGRWASDVSVSYVSSGLSLVPVASAPLAGQYVPPKLEGVSYYQFNTADKGLQVSLTYSYIPQDIELAVIMQVAELYKYRARIGEKSRTLGSQETVSYLIQDFHPAVKSILRPYINNAKSLVG